jgi:hypothetical protein
MALPERICLWNTKRTFSRFPLLRNYFKDCGNLVLLFLIESHQVFFLLSPFIANLQKLTRWLILVTLESQHGKSKDCFTLLAENSVRCCSHVGPSIFATKNAVKNF